MSASRVHSANSTRTTSRGSTQWTAVSRGGSAKGGSSRSSPRRRASRSCRGRASRPPPPPPPDLLPPPCLHLEPGVRAAARLVPAGAPLGHDALEALCLGGLEERLAITLDVARVAHQRVVPQALAQEPLSLLERGVAPRAARGGQG